MKNILIFCCGLLALPLLAGCAANKPQQLQYEILPVDYRVAKADAAPGSYLMQSVADLNKLIDELGLEPVSHEYDYAPYFENNDLLLIYGGQKPTTGFKVSTLEISASKKVLNVKAELQTPKAGCVLAQMITYPMELMAIPKFKSGINQQFELCSREVGC